MEYKMKQTLLLLILLLSEPCLAGEYSDCILENMKGVNVPFAANQVKIACKEKALPYASAKCHYTNEQMEFMAKENPRNILNLSYDDLVRSSACVEKCLNASFIIKRGYKNEYIQ